MTCATRYRDDSSDPAWRGRREELVESTTHNHSHSIYQLGGADIEAEQRALEAVIEALSLLLSPVVGCRHWVIEKR